MANSSYTTVSRGGQYTAQLSAVYYWVEQSTNSLTLRNVAMDPIEIHYIIMGT